MFQKLFDSPHSRNKMAETMSNNQKQAIIRNAKILRDPALKAARDEARATAREEKAIAKAAMKAELAAQKAAEKAAQPPKKRGRPRKVVQELTDEPPSLDMPTYELLDTLRKRAEDVYAELGAGHTEAIYHAAMAVGLREDHIDYESEQIMPVTYRGQFVGTVRADIIVKKECVLEFKISGKMDDAVQQARQYMKLQKIQFGFVVMFPKTDGGKVQFVDARLPDVPELDM
jgi:GxxExxY protein